MKKVVSIILSVISLCLLFSGCSGNNSKISEIKDRGTLRVGVKSDVMNFGYMSSETGEYEGLEIDIAKEFAKVITGDEKNISFEAVTAATRDTLLNNNNIDMIIATFTITEERKNTHNFSQPYYTDEIGFLVKKDSNIKSSNDMGGKLLGVTLSSTAYNEFGENSTFSSSTKPVRKEFANYPEVKNALLTGQIDIFAADKSILYGYLDESTVLLDEGFKSQPYGIATKLDDKSFAKYIDKHLAEMKDKGTLEEILNRWITTNGK